MTKRKQSKYEALPIIVTEQYGTLAGDRKGLVEYMMGDKLVGRVHKVSFDNTSSFTVKIFLPQALSPVLWYKMQSKATSAARRVIREWLAHALPNHPSHVVFITFKTPSPHYHTL